MVEAAEPQSLCLEVLVQCRQRRTGSSCGVGRRQRRTRSSNGYCISLGPLQEKQASQEEDSITVGKNSDADRQKM